MASTREIRRRIKSVKNIGQITRAMELVAAAKMRRAQETALAGRTYNKTMYDMLSHLLPGVNVADYRLLQQSENAKKSESSPLVVVFGPDKGLSGPLATNLIREVGRYVASHPNARLVTMGKRSRDGLLKLGGNVIADFPLVERPRLRDILPLTRLVLQEYEQGRCSEVLIASTQFINTMQQMPHIQGLLPLTPQLLNIDYLQKDEALVGEDVAEFIIEPSIKAILEQLLPRFVEMTVYQALLDALASQYSAQMMAMRSASDNASDLQSELTLTYNQLRQASITAELAEIAAGSGM